MEQNSTTNAMLLSTKGGPACHPHTSSTFRLTPKHCTLRVQIAAPNYGCLEFISTANQTEYYFYASWKRITRLPLINEAVSTQLRGVVGVSVSQAANYVNAPDFIYLSCCSLVGRL